MTTQELDVCLIHAPSVYDFRDRDDVLFAYLSNSDSVHVSPIFEMPPVGLLSIEQHARGLGLSAQFFNVASKMLRDPTFSVEAFFERVNARWIGFDLHWLVHAHGALALAELYKRIHPEAKTIFGGISATFYHDELVRYPQVDYVVRGYDTLLPLERLYAADDLPERLEEVPNLTWKLDGEPRANAMSHVPRSYGVSVDWADVFRGDERKRTPYNLVIPQAGCEYSCTWCGGSRYFFKKYMGLSSGPARVHKPVEELKRELGSVARAGTRAHTLTMVDFWHEYEELFAAASDVFVDESIHCVHYSLHRLPTIEKGRRMANGVKAVLELSPDSHDLEVARASGRGKYTMAEMEAFIDALIDQVYSFEIYFLIGLPLQTPESVLETVEYCGELLRKYRGKNVTPFVCPMLPFLDPGSEISDYPERFGFTLSHRTLEDHRRALISLNWKDRLNYETKWMSRDQLVDVSYEAVRRLTLLKQEYRQMPEVFARAVVGRIDRTRELLREIDAFQALPEGPARDARAIEIKARVLEYNRDQLKQVRSQQRPVDAGFTRQQWFDTDAAFDP
jgi:clorobiocin biosynthesis protein CloN6